MLSNVPSHIDHFENDPGYIYSIHVEDEFRRRRISNAIMARLHKEAKKREIRKIGLDASESDHRVYESLGYKENNSYLEAAL